MPNVLLRSLLLTGLLVWFAVGCAPRRPVRVLVDSNLGNAVRTLAQDYQAATGNPLEVVVRQPALLAQQIRLGYPFDVLLLADTLLLSHYGLSPWLSAQRTTLHQGHAVLATRRQAEHIKPNATVALSPTGNPLAISAEGLLPRGGMAVPVLLDEQLPYYAAASLTDYAVVYDWTARQYGLNVVAHDKQPVVAMAFVATESTQQTAAASFLDFLHDHLPQKFLASQPPSP